MKSSKLWLMRPLLLIATVIYVAPIPVAGAQTVTASSTNIDPAAIAALNKMGEYLRGLGAFQVRAVTTREDVLTDGEKIQTAAVADILAQRPNRLRVEVNSDDQHRLYFYDGKNFTVFAGRLGYYASAPAPPTIPRLVDLLDEKYGINVPLTDLFYWGTDKSSVGDITVARDIGSTQVEGTTTQQYAFRQNGLDWQIWIQNGEYPLPRKLVLTTTTDDARPQYTAVLTWNLAPSFNDAAFVFDPPAGANKIVLADVNAPVGASKK